MYLAPQSVVRRVMEVRRQLHVKASPSFHFCFFTYRRWVSQSIWACRVWRAACGRRAWASQHPGLSFLISLSSSLHVSHPGTGRGSGFWHPNRWRAVMEVRRQLHVKASPSYHFLFHLQALGVAVDLGPQSVARCVREAGVGFMYAPRYHPAMAAVRHVRKELGVSRRHRCIVVTLKPPQHSENVRAALPPRHSRRSPRAQEAGGACRFPFLTLPHFYGRSLPGRIRQPPCHVSRAPRAEGAGGAQQRLFETQKLAF